jgi:hypothetical protein
MSSKSEMIKEAVVVYFKIPPYFPAGTNETTKRLRLTGYRPNEMGSVTSSLYPVGDVTNPMRFLSIRRYFFRLIIRLLNDAIYFNCIE